QEGMVLLEGLLAILIFSLGILGMIGMQAVTVKQVGDARYRSEASLLADELIGRMRVSAREPAQLQAAFSTGQSGYALWREQVAAVLPGLAANPPTVVVDADGLVTITLFWLAPNEAADAARHRHIAIAQ